MEANLSHLNWCNCTDFLFREVFLAVVATGLYVGSCYQCARLRVGYGCAQAIVLLPPWGTWTGQGSWGPQTGCPGQRGALSIYSFLIQKLILFLFTWNTQLEEEIKIYIPIIPFIVAFKTRNSQWINMYKPCRMKTNEHK